MPDPHYPSVDLDFILNHVNASGKLAHGGIARFGSTTTLVIEGHQAIYKRSTLIRELEPGQICLEQATAVALKFAFLGQLLEWLVTNRNWREGAYIVP
ncbi:hypothetical protein ESA94_13655 [Lacibacter luteus]|uniref:Uncharacterized protein n=1 Tax=Lacibacter luteus TaxID=2508719 RepID=A0A4Q1CH11_9BACT|nr:hypothetical protein [Lacibacter luteus]RXK59181.1 hypothetical protein ESA94_13655 [Lacibacter luteus]